MRSHLKFQRYGMFLLAAVLSSCAANSSTNRGGMEQNTIRIKGSDTMLLLARRWSEVYMAQNPGVAIYVEGGGSATGLDALISGSVDIATTSRPLRPEESRSLAQKYGSLGVSTLCARDALSIYLHPDNPIDDLDISQLREIFTGRIRNWSELGGPDLPITVLSRNPSSGTFLFFLEHVLLNQEFGANVRYLPTTRAIATKVLEDPSAIGYGGMAYGREVKHAAVSGVQPTPENVRDGIYPVSRYLYLYTVRETRGLARQFIDWVLGAEGQRLVEDVGYIPLFKTE